jgi:TRAP-type mannitol/chloroaromatic compound transport system permease large subunit
MATIFKAAINFMVLQWIGVGLCIIFPAIVIWLPSIIYAGH